MPRDWSPSRAPARGAPAEPRPGELDEVRSRQAREIQALRDTATVYRSGAAALAIQVSQLRGEVARLRGKLRANRASQGIRDIEVTITLDDYAPDLVRAIAVAELADGLSPNALEDVQLVASELAASSARRWASSPEAEAVVRMEPSGAVLHVELQDLATAPERPAQPVGDAIDDLGLDMVRRLSERWGIEESASGHRTVWADVMDRSR